MAEPVSGMRREEPTEFAYRSWPADARQLGAIRGQVRCWLAPFVLPEDDEDDVVLAVSEAASNCIEHAYDPAIADGTVELTFWTETRNVCFEIVDHGAWRKPSGRPTSRGRGIELMRRLMAGVLIHYDRRGTRVFLSHPLPDDAAAQSATARVEEVGAAFDPVVVRANGPPAWR
jgi:serine/threonine-protein kinase RsbW